jgi:hypothetical protein
MMLFSECLLGPVYLLMSVVIVVISIFGMWLRMLPALMSSWLQEFLVWGTHHGSWCLRKGG